LTACDTTVTVSGGKPLACGSHCSHAAGKAAHSDVVSYTA